MQVNGTAVNDVVMEEFIKELEPIIIREEEYVIGNENDENVIKSEYNYIVKKIDSELNGKYYEIMYGKKQIKENEKAAKN